MDENFTYHDTELLNSYLDKELPAEQEAAVAAQIAADTGLQDKIDNLLLARTAIQAQGLKERMAALHKKYHQATEAAQAAAPAPVRSIKPSRFLLRAAAAVLVLFMGYGAYFYAGTTGNSVYEDNYTAYQLPVTRSADFQGVPTDSLYMAGNFDGVISKWKQIGEKSQQDYFLTAMAFLEKNQPAEAISVLKDLQVRNSREQKPLFEDEIDYYLAMAYIKTGKIDEARKILSAIRDNPGHVFYQKAKKISNLRLKVLDIKN